MTKLALLTLPLLLAACATTSATTLPDRTARIGQTVRVGGPSVRPIAVIEDSRCPTDVTCVWAGRVVIRAAVGTGSGTRQVELTLGTPIPVADGMLTLTQVTPATRQGKPVPPRDYRFSFTFVGSI